MLIVFAPILVPAMEAYGIDTLYFGIVLVLTVLVGSITPPVGSLLYLGSSIAKTTVSKAGKEVMDIRGDDYVGNWASCDFSTDCFVFA